MVEKIAAEKVNELVNAIRSPVQVRATIPLKYINIIPSHQSLIDYWRLKTKPQEKSFCRVHYIKSFKINVGQHR